MPLSKLIANISPSLERWNQTLERSSFARYLERTDFGRIILNAMIIIPIIIGVLCLNALIVGLLSFPFMCVWNLVAVALFGFHQMSFWESFVILSICSMTPTIQIDLYGAMRR